MDCVGVREAISAGLDGEAIPMSTELIVAHLDSCGNCRQWQTDATDLHRRVRITPAEEIPDLTPGILAAIGAADPETEAERLRACRFMLALCALLQLAATVPSLVGQAGVPIHLDHELGAWDIALAIGFIVCAARPARAWGMLPFVAAVAFTLGATAALDITDGHTSLAGECSHIGEVMGLGFLWMVARFHRSSNSVSRAFA